MTTINIEDAGKHDAQEVTIQGWLYNLRESGKLLFPIFRDGTGIIQGVAALKESPDASPEKFAPSSAPPAATKSASPKSKSCKKSTSLPPIPSS